MSDEAEHSWHVPVTHPQLPAGTTHVWRVRLDDASVSVEAHLAHLSEYEQERVRRFYFPHHGTRYAIAHSALRQIISAYTGVESRKLEFQTTEHGKPELMPVGTDGEAPLHFNLSHSGNLALVAVARHGAVGVDVERWRTNVHHLDIAERFFSPLEREALQTIAQLALAPDALLEGFFSTWSRKEAYLKATGHGISRGLHHFDVTTGEGAASLLADRLDPQAVNRWEMRHIRVGPGYSAALVSERSSPQRSSPQRSSPQRSSSQHKGAVHLFDSPYI